MSRKRRSPQQSKQKQNNKANNKRRVNTGAKATNPDQPYVVTSRVSPIPQRRQSDDNNQQPPRITTALLKLVGGRQTQPSNANPLGLLSYAFLPRRQYQDLDLTELTNSQTLNAQQILDLLADISPEVSQATWNMVRLVNGGWKFEVRTPDKTREVPEGTQYIENLIERINSDSGGLDAIINAWTLTAYLQGALAGEIALTLDLTDVEDIYPSQPWTIFFERDAYQRLVPFQQQIAVSSPTDRILSQVSSIKNSVGNNSGGGGGGSNAQDQDSIVGTGGYAVAGYPYRRLNPVTFGYFGLDSGPDDPYGRSPAAPVLQLIVFYLQVLKDLRQNIHQAAWGRLHIKILEEVLLKNAPDAIRQDFTGDAQRDYVNARIAEINTAYNRLAPDDTFISSDSISLTPLDFSGKTVINADVIMRVIERLLIRALKQLPVLMGSNEGVTETHGTVQMDIYVAGVMSLQRIIAAMLKKLFTVALQVRGINARIDFTFNPPRANDQLKQAQSDSIKAQLLAYQRDQGWITNDDASIQMTGSKAVAEPKPGPVALATLSPLNPQDEVAATAPATAQPKPGKPKPAPTDDDADEASPTPPTTTNPKDK